MRATDPPVDCLQAVRQLLQDGQMPLFARPVADERDPLTDADDAGQEAPEP
jgi:hypothetical protein